MKEWVYLIFYKIIAVVVIVVLYLNRTLILSFLYVKMTCLDILNVNTSLFTNDWIISLQDGTLIHHLTLFEASLVHLSIVTTYDGVTKLWLIDILEEFNILVVILWKSLRYVRILFAIWCLQSIWVVDGGIHIWFFYSLKICLILFLHHVELEFVRSVLVAYIQNQVLKHIELFRCTLSLRIVNIDIV